VIFHRRRFAYDSGMKTLVLLALIATPAFATTQDDILQATLLPGWVTPDGTRMAALQLVMAPGWKTYWRSPGDAGIPPSFDWTGSQNMKGVRYHWPNPTVFDTNGLRSIGYHDVLVLPVEVTPLDPSQPVLLQGRVDLGICNDICIPAMVDVSVDLPVEGSVNPTIKQALRDQPTSGAAAGLTDIRCTVDAIDDGLRVTAVMGLPAQGGAEAVVLEPGLPGVWVAEAQVSRTGGILTAMADMVAQSGAPFALDRSAVVVTIIGDGHAVEIKGCPGG
jgi:DsbC/DsbD-like thiol-disulfide interchange protein